MITELVIPVSAHSLTVTWFAVSIAVLSYFDIAMPRGDTLGVSGALSAAAVVLLSPAEALVAAVAGTAIALVLRARERGGPNEWTVLVAELSGLTATALVLTTGLFSGVPQWIQALVAACIFLLVELLIVQLFVSVRTGRGYSQLIGGNIGSQASLLAAQVSAAILATVIYPRMGGWSLLLVVALLLLMRQSYALLWGIRETYRATVEVLVEAAEGGDSRLSGHAERTAQLAREIAYRCGFRSREIERIGYAALLHDLDVLGRPAPSHADGGPEEVLGGIGLFEDVIPLLRLKAGEAEGARVKDSDLLAAYIVALASDIDVEARPELKAIHPTDTNRFLAHVVPQAAKAKAVSAALHSGYRIPAVS